MLIRRAVVLARVCIVAVPPDCFAKRYTWLRPDRSPFPSLVVKNGSKTCDKPQPECQRRYQPVRRHKMCRARHQCQRAKKLDPAKFPRQDAAIRHGVAGVHTEVQQASSSSPGRHDAQGPPSTRVLIFDVAAKRSLSIFRTWEHFSKIENAVRMSAGGRMRLVKSFPRLTRWRSSPGICHLFVLDGPPQLSPHR